MVMVIFMKNHHVKWGIPELDGHMGYAILIYSKLLECLSCLLKIVLILFPSNHVSLSRGCISSFTQSQIVQLCDLHN